MMLMMLASFPDHFYPFADCFQLVVPFRLLVSPLQHMKLTSFILGVALISKSI